MINKNNLLKILNLLGEKSGCHRKKERSFFYKSYQFPICARCTGVFLGNVILISSFMFYIPELHYLFCGCFIMYIDWNIQFLNIKKSTNIRRLITGIIGGYSVSAICLLILKWLISIIIGDINV